MARKAPPAPAAAAEPAAEAAPTLTHREAAALILQAVAGLPPEQAQDRLRRASQAQSPGLARRALLRARIALWQGQAIAPAPVEAPPYPVPDLPEAPPPRPLRAGALSTMALEDAAKMLFATDPDDEPEAEVPPETDPGASGLADVANLFAQMNAPEPEPDATAVSEDPAEPPDSAAFTTAESEGILAQDAGDADAAAAPDPAAFHPHPPSKTAAQMAKADLDLTAAFAALGDDMPEAAAAPPQGDPNPDEAGPATPSAAAPDPSA